MAQVSSRSRGTVKWFNDTKGFGFISPDDGGEDLFVHQSSIKAEGYRTLAEGEVVEFVVTEGDDGRTKAVDVTGPDGSNVQCGSGGGHSGGARFNGSGGGGRGGGGGGWRLGGGAKRDLDHRRLGSSRQIWSATPSFFRMIYRHNRQIQTAQRKTNDTIRIRSSLTKSIRFFSSTWAPLKFTNKLSGSNMGGGQ
ncbi:hypothetical protein GW17_00045978 [Ensete ventricosum]|nr:hypothetical protein GW17_00045978 [Ensete ventricosum]